MEFAPIRAASATMGGTTKHHVPNRLKKNAAAAAPTAKAVIAIPMRRRRLSVAIRVSATNREWRWRYRSSIVWWSRSGCRRDPGPSRAREQILALGVWNID